MGEAGKGEDAVELAFGAIPEGLLMDITMPGMDGMEATGRLHGHCPDCQVLALTVHDDKQYLMQMLAAGASGYITKQAAADELVEAIHTIAAGNVYLQPALARWLLEDYQRLAHDGNSSGTAAAEPGEAKVVGLSVLSQRERQVLEMVAHGDTNQEIGRQPKLSHKTIARHRERIMKKLNIHSRTELIKFAIRTGLVQLE